MPSDTRYGAASIIIGSESSAELELERFYDASTDTILPFYRLPLTNEHLAAWAADALRKAGCTCKRLVLSEVSAGVRRATRKDQALVYYFLPNPFSVTLVRQGREWTVEYGRLGPRDESDFIHFVIDLIGDDQSQAKTV